MSIEKKKQMIEKMAEIIDNIDDNAYITETRWDGYFAQAHSEKIAKELLKHYQPKISENSAENHFKISEEKYSAKKEEIDQICKERTQKIFRELLKHIIEINESNEQGLIENTYYCVSLAQIKKVATDVGFEFELEIKE